MEAEAIPQPKRRRCWYCGVRFAKVEPPCFGKIHTSTVPLHLKCFKEFRTKAFPVYEINFRNALVLAP